MGLPYKLAIFDCDGVLFDSREANRCYYNALLEKLNLAPMNEEQLDFCHVHTANEAIEFLLQDQPESIKERARDIVKEIDYAPFLKYMKFEPGVVDTLSSVRDRLYTAISTNRSSTMPLLVRMYNLDTFFHKIVCALDVNNPKPDPEGVFKILKFFGIEPNQAIYIGDSIVDQIVAQNAGIPLIAYKNDDLDAMFHVEHFLEIKEILIGTR